jgi:putative FmdB family regulatory protein
MPIYEYLCGDCGHKLEKMQRVSDDPLTDCPSCGADSLQKLISPVGFRLKGTGWYETDFKDKPKPAKEKDAKPEGESKTGNGAGKGAGKADAAVSGSSAKSTAGSGADD